MNANGKICRGADSKTAAWTSYATAYRKLHVLVACIDSSQGRAAPALLRELCTELTRHLAPFQLRMEADAHRELSGLARDLVRLLAVTSPEARAPALRMIRQLIAYPLRARDPIGDAISLPASELREMRREIDALHARLVADGAPPIDLEDPHEVEPSSSVMPTSSHRTAVTQTR